MIEFSVNDIATGEECDLLIAEANEDIDILNDEKIILGVEQGKAEKVSTDVQAEISATNIELEGVKGIIPSLSPGKQKVYKRRQNRLENKLDTLGFRREDQGSTKLLRKQFELGKIDAELAEIARFIAAVSARKAAIIAAAG